MKPARPSTSEHAGIISRVHRCGRAWAALALVAVLAAGAGCADDPEERRVALRGLIAALRLEPQPGDDAVRFGRVKSKSDYPYYVATGVLDEETREAGLARVVAAFEREGWSVFETGSEERFLGACLRARSGSMVASAHVGWSTRTGFNPYPRLSGRVYVQTAIGREGSNQAWTDPERPSCGS